MSLHMDGIRKKTSWEKMHNFRSIFLENHIDKIFNKNVIELSAGDGMVSVNITELNPARFVISDNDLEMLSFNPLKDTHETLILDVLNLPDLSEYKFDTIICCGYLYHTAHPLWAVEQILKNTPKWFYIETFMFEENNYCRLLDEELGKRGMQTFYKGAIPKNLHLPKSILIESINSLGYALVDVIKNDTKPEDFYVGHNENFSLSFWKTCTGLWFEKND